MPKNCVNDNSERRIIIDILLKKNKNEQLIKQNQITRKSSTKIVSTNIEF